MLAVISLELELPETKLVGAFRQLSPRRRIELLSGLQALREPELRTVPVSSLYALTGLVSLGGNALADTESLYDGNSGH